MRFLRAPLAALLLGLATVPAASPEARASVSIAVTYDGLLRETSLAAVVTPVEQHAYWENGRIYTYTRVTVDRVVAGPQAPEAWVRTMGGIVGDIGQSVDGEAVLVVGRQSLLFLHPLSANATGIYEVTARGQGQFPIVVDDKKATRVVRAGGVGALLPPKARVPAAPSPLAADVLHGRLLDDVARDVAGAFKRVHATK
jgi:hypothetical protein